MPIYMFENIDTGDQFELMMKISEKEDYLKLNQNIKSVITPIAIVRGIIGKGKMKNDDGFKETMSKIAEAHPNTPLAKEYSKKSIKQIKTEQAIIKHYKKSQDSKKM